MKMILKESIYNSLIGLAA